MEQIIKINVPEGKVAKYNEQTRTIEFIDKEPVRSKSWEEFCANHANAVGEWYVTSYGNVNASTPYDENGTQRCGNAYLSTKEDAEGILALVQLTRLHDEWVGNWKPDFKNKNANQTSIGFVKGDIHIEYNNYRNRLLTFPNYYLAVEFKDCFKDLLEKAKKFI